MSRTTRKLRWIALFGAYFLFVLTPAAHAYLDPGSGSVIFQAVIGGLLAVGVVTKAFWHRLGRLFSRRKPEGADERPEKIG